MEEGRSTSMLWAAHVLPIYVTCFDVSEEDAIKLLVDLDLMEWVEGSKKAVTLKDLTSRFKTDFLNDSSIPGQGYLHSNTGVPDQR